MFGMLGCSGPVSKKLTNGVEYPIYKMDQGLTAGPTFNWQLIAEQDVDNQDYLDDIPGVIVRKRERDCNLSVDTERGLFSVAVAGAKGEINGDEACEIATKSFYRIYNQLREQK
ncbi:hypothetical protein CUTER_05940 [Corynebacterium uterequi]|uniref:DUF3558 family protein n=2 Tax=Corynebacterium uterequi TaxID=1072256 RepID=A0A0G3HD28_9CORY|nr:hypothetical protein CUTER_05940 [Corynebacterium uterequi]